MKKLFLILFLLPFAFQLNAQTQCDELQAENENLKAKNSELNNQIKYLKETLNLLKSNIKSTIDNVQFSINEVIGNKETNEVEIIGIYQNLDVMKTFQSRDAKFIDPQGNQYTYEINLREKGPRVENVRTGIPMKFNIKFKGVDSNTPQIRILVLRLYGNNPGIRDPEGTFENLKIDWK